MPEKKEFPSGGLIRLPITCPEDGSAVVVEGQHSRSGMHIAGCSRWSGGLECQASCATQVELEYSVELARRVQEMFEPPAEFHLGELSVATWMSVSERVGGDFQVVRPFGSVLRVIQGDVVGKGLSAALLAAYLVGLYDALSGQGLQPTEVLRAMNIATAERTEARPMFATVVALEADLVGGTWKYARAGHELPLLVRASGQSVHFHDSSGLPVGVERDESYTECQAPMLDGDRLFLATDGTLEVGLTGPHVLQSLQGCRGSVSRCLKELVARIPCQPPRDDVTLALIGFDRDS